MNKDIIEDELYLYLGQYGLTTEEWDVCAYSVCDGCLIEWHYNNFNQTGLTKEIIC